MGFAAMGCVAPLLGILIDSKPLGILQQRQAKNGPTEAQAMLQHQPEEIAHPSIWDH